MRKLLNARLIFSITMACAGVGVWAACSDDPAATVPDATPDAGSTDDQDTGAPPVLVFDSGVKQPVKDAAPDVITFIPPPEVFIDAGPEFDGGFACFAGGELELEPNDDKANANVLKPVRCGRVIVTDGGASDTDWLTFQPADASSNFRLYYEGKVSVVVETDGMAPTDISIEGQTLQFHPGQPYYIEVKSKDAGTQFWKVLLKEE